MPQESLQVGQKLEGFTVERIEEIAELRSIARIFLHEKSGARLAHLLNDDPNNLFAVAFRTPVSDHTGVPHILEHSVLCGSRKFPIKDPFQELLKGSLQTFLNALTYPDKTMYPVSSQVEVDFFNLVDIYCDAVFHPLLSNNTFYQEGWHFDVERPEGPVDIKGIVYNEMKGVFSDFASHVERKTIANLFPDVSYRFESGGLPEHITDLTYEQFKAFHALYYHPSNAYVFLYGNIPSAVTLKFLNENYLNEYDRIRVASEIRVQPLWKRPRSIELEAPAPPADDGYATVALSWIFDSATNAAASLLGGVLFHYFLGTESAPLKRALIDSHLGEDLDDITGFSSEFVQSVFSVGLRKTKPEHAAAIKKIVFDTLAAEVEKGLDEELLEGSLRQIEFKLREISDAGRFPYNLLLAERCFRSWLYGGDPLAYVAFEKNISFLRERKKEGRAYYTGKIRDLLIDNNHHLLTVVKASSAMGKNLETQTLEQAGRLSRDFSEADMKNHHALTMQLIREQKTPSAPEALAALPRLKKSDVPRNNQEVAAIAARIARAPAYLHPLFTSGIAYVDIGFDCSSVDASAIPYLPLYAELASRCGAAGMSYEEMSRRTALATGGIHGSLLCETHGADGALVFKYFLHGKALIRRVSDMAGIFSDLLLSPKLDNARQLHDVLFEMRNDLNASVINSGHVFAATHAASRLVASKFIDETIDGVTQLRFLDNLLKNFDADAVIEKITALHALLIDGERCMVSITADDPHAITASIESLLQKLPVKNSPTVSVEASAKVPSTFEKHLVPARCIEISSSVNFVAKAWRCPDFGPESLGRYFVLSKNLSTDYLWNKVRVEGGAYGGMAMLSSGHPVFMCASYRDPNLASTLRHFEAALQSIAPGIDAEAIDQNIIATIGRIDAPRTPHEKGFGETIALLCGRSKEFRRQVREAVLSATPRDLSEKARQLLDEKETAVTMLGSPSAFDKAQQDGLDMRREKLL
jgi:hypothetical protein